MRNGSSIAWGLLGVALVAGTISDQAVRRPLLRVGGYRMLAVDLHVHTFPLSASTLAPWDLVLEARRQGLDAIAVTGHNEAVSGKVGRWFSKWIGGPAVIAGEEIHGPRYHMIAAGIEHAIGWRLSAAEAIDEIHRQGGVAIAAHPTAGAWPAFDAEAMRKLDGAEVGQPAGFQGRKNAQEMREFYRRSGAAAIGSSDWHGMGPVGLCRTYIFAKDDSVAAILDAIRARRTVVLDRGLVFGDPVLAQLAGSQLGRELPARGWLQWVSAVCGAMGLAGLAILNLLPGPFRHGPPPAPHKEPAEV